jgi:hypothetical protein
LQLRDHGFDFIELAVWRVLRLLACIADEFALVVRRDFAVAAKRAELGGGSIGGSEDQKRGARGGPPLPGAPGITRGFIGSRPSRCNFLRASLRARRMASAFSRTLFSEGFS